MYENNIKNQKYSKNIFLVSSGGSLIRIWNVSDGV